MLRKNCTKFHDRLREKKGIQYKSFGEAILMCRKNVLILLLSIVLASFLLYAGAIEKTLGTYTDKTIKNRNFSVQVNSGNNVEYIQIWENEDGRYFVFLPAYARVAESFFMMEEMSAVIDGVSISSSISCERFNMNVVYPFSFVQNGTMIDSTIMFVQSDKIPAMYIDTESENMDYIHETKGNEEHGKIRIYLDNGQVDYNGRLDFIKGRGNSTWEEIKKPYSIKLDYAADLLGMGSAEKWILLADACDESGLRNKVGFDLAQKAGMEFTPESQWVDLYLNGVYAGLYLLTERNEVHNQRVDISYSDSFLVSMERGDRLAEQGYPYVSTQSNLYFRIHHSSLSMDDLTAIWQSIENAIVAEDGVDPISGKSWEELIDIDSWVMRFLVDEVLANFDGGTLSQFFYYDASGTDGKVKAGPVWDLDNILAEGEFTFKEPNVIAAHREHTMWDTELVLFAELYKKTVFRERIFELYQEIFMPLAEKLAETEIEQYADYLSEPMTMNGIRWNMPDPGMGAEVVQKFLKERISFLNEYWLSDEEYHLVYLIQEDWPWDCLAVRSGEPLPDIVDESEGWCVMSSEELFDISQPICEDIILVLGNVDFQLEKEKYDDIITYDDVIPDEDSNSSTNVPPTLQWMIPVLVLMVFLMAFFIIDAMRAGIWKRRKKANGEISSIK